jgi:ferredoxin
MPKAPPPGLSPALHPASQEKSNPETDRSLQPPVHLQLHPDGPRWAVQPGQTLWQSLQDVGVVWPVSCRNGTCRSCLGRLLQGKVRYTVEWPGLLPEEKTQGYVLPCVAGALSDVVLARP